ncbi:hypothetical protein Q1695_011013 [Nippostrongylus brasiliensis]|nr:hypothetical protein Q1695_011013 [Nippostrongylus brasiliensis]
MLWLAVEVLFALVFSKQEPDLVENIPGLEFEVNFKTYSGYLNANDKQTWRMHYILTESKSEPDEDPLLIWFNGGPGCSSFSGLLQELGPFYVNYDGKTLFENKYAWNTKANVLFLETPIGTGFSYDTEHDRFAKSSDDQTAEQNYHALIDFFENPIGTGFSYDTEHDRFAKSSDDQTAEQNYHALIDFFENVHPKYNNRPFFLGGESYAGIYIPMLSELIVEGINDGSFPNINFQGAAIGNGYMNAKHNQNSMVLWSAYHGRVSIEDWDYIKAHCTNGVTDMDRVDYTVHMNMVSNLEYVAKDDDECGRRIGALIDVPNGTIPYHYYLDCYDGALNKTPAEHRHSKFEHPSIKGNFDGNFASLINYISTDSYWGYSCWGDSAVSIYLNTEAVQKAFHIPNAWRRQGGGTHQWTPCSDDVSHQYNATYRTTNAFFDYVLKNVQTPNFRFLIFSGDVDFVCNFLGSSWHVYDVAKAANLKIRSNAHSFISPMTTFQSSPLYNWQFSANSQTAGYYQRYSGKNRFGVDITIDLLTVKGAGHMVPIDRPGPSLQMITNFMLPNSSGQVDYSSAVNIVPDPPLSKYFGSGSSSPVHAVLQCLVPLVLFNVFT